MHPVVQALLVLTLIGAVLYNLFMHSTIAKLRATSHAHVSGCSLNQPKFTFEARAYQDFIVPALASHLEQARTWSGIYHPVLEQLANEHLIPFTTYCVEQSVQPSWRAVQAALVSYGKLDDAFAVVRCVALCHNMPQLIK